MAVGKNPRLSKGGKRTAKKKIGDTMTNKEWYDIVAPATFKTRHCGKTVANRSKGTFSGPENIKGRVFINNLADLMDKSEDDVHKCRNVSLKAEDVEGRNVLTNFHSMSITTDKLRSMMKKWVSLIEATVECKTSDGYQLRVFAMALTKKRAAQVKKNCYCQSSHVKKIREQMTAEITKTVTRNPLEKVVKNLQQDSMGEDIKKACLGIFPLEGVNIRKVKVVRAPKFDAVRLVEVVHGGSNSIPKSVEGGRQLQEDVKVEAEAEEADD